MHLNGRLNLAKYGKIVREEITATHRIVHLFSPKDMKELFAQEGRYPCRRSHRALLRYRAERPHLYASGGIFPENGPEWARLRDTFKRHFLLARNVNAYDRLVNDITDDLVGYVRRTRSADTLEVADFQEDLYRWALESICSIMLDARIGCLGVDLSEESDPSRLIRAAHQTIHAVMKTELYSSWQSRDTADYRELVQGQDVMAEIVGKHLKTRIRELESGVETDKNGDSLLAQFILNPEINRKDLFAMILDCVLAGIDTTSITASFALYFLARHPQYQERLREEVFQVMERNHVGQQTPQQITGKRANKSSVPITLNLLIVFKYFLIAADHLTSMPWLKAIVKETLRLRPVSIGVGRLTSTPVEIGGYQVPSNTMIITQNQVSCQQEEYFPQADCFKPERWMVDRSKAAPATAQAQAADNRYLWLPFGHGTRMCLGRRIAELEMYILLCKVVANFKVEYHHEDIGVKTMLINLPDRPMKFKFTDL